MTIYLRKQKLLRFAFVVCFCVGCAACAGAAPVRYAIIPENPFPGEAVTIGIDADNSDGVKSAVLYDSDGQRLSKSDFFVLEADKGEKRLAAAVLTVPSTAEPGFAVIKMEGGADNTAEIPLVIRERAFASEEIPLDDTLTEIRTAPDPQKTAEAEQLWAILNRHGNEIYALGNFSPPVSSTRRTGHFGDRRIFRYSNGKSDTAIHAGVDYGVPTGTPVTSCAPGKVVLARFRIVTGHTVIIEHLPGMYSLYYHLDKIETSEGALTVAGDLIGLSGSTGLSTGPHLHWEIRVSGENTDPDALISRPILDKDAILAKIGK